MTRLENYSLLRHNTFGIDAECSVFYEYNSLEELISIVKRENLHCNKYLHIGGGSNLLFVQNYDGVVLHSGMKCVKVISEDDDFVTVSAESGVVWDDLVQYAVDCDWYGAENLSLIPGEVGAVPVQNIGAYGVEAKDVVYSVTVLDVETCNVKEFMAEECLFGYRTSKFKREWKDRFIVLSVSFKFSKKPSYKLEYGNLRSKLDGQEITLKSVREAIIDIRNSKLPSTDEIGSAGSFFKNPVVPVEKFLNLRDAYENMPSYDVSETEKKIPAGWLIEQCGWKGKCVGNAGVYDKQALIIINKGGATGAEIVELSERIQADVKAKFDIEIEPEVCFIK